MMRIRNWFYWKIDNKVVFLRTSLLYWNSYNNIVEELNNKYGYTVETVPCPPPAEFLKDWVNIVNDAYEDAHYDKEKASSFFQNHAYLDLLDLHFIVNESGNRIGTIISGIYKENPHIGGVCRIALLHKYQRQGLGQYLPLLGYSCLKNRVDIGESLIASKRKRSLFLHFKLGFRPVLTKSGMAYTAPLRKVNRLQRIRLKCRLIRTFVQFLSK